MFRFIVVVAVLAGIVWGGFQLEGAHFTSPGPAAANGAAETIVLVQPGEGLAAISEELAQAGTIDNALLFQFGVRLRGKSAALKAGEYAIRSQASMADIMAILESGKSIQHKITAAEGLTSQMIYDLVKNDSELTGDMGELPAEGLLLPETYLFIRGTTRSDIIERMREAQKKFLDAQWAMRTPNLPVASKRQAVILASIVEKETAIPEERRHIAAVFVNRLRIGMKLQSDPTIIYGITKGYPLGRGIRESELVGPTPYNTYVIAGLPPTPICNPGKDSIAAVLNPETSNDLYFVATGKGGHVFSASIEQHEKNVANLRHLEQRQR
ncbi:MAG: endolytic transglycosylase MltG [Rhizomicrobium sp.]|jgi:UPF0755 protein